MAILRGLKKLVHLAKLHKNLSPTKLEYDLMSEKRNDHLVTNLVKYCVQLFICLVKYFNQRTIFKLTCREKSRDRRDITNMTNLRPTGRVDSYRLDKI